MFAANENSGPEKANGKKEEEIKNEMEPESRIEDYYLKKNAINALCGLTARSVITRLFIIIIFMYIGLCIARRARAGL